MERLDEITDLLAKYEIDNKLLALDIAILVAHAERSQIIKDMAL